LRCDFAKEFMKRFSKSENTENFSYKKNFTGLKFFIEHRAAMVNHGWEFDEKK
jgi:hypothetical protein